MSSLQVISGHYHICFRFNGHRYKRALKTTRPDQADARRVRLEETIRLVETGRLDIPDDVCDVASFLLADGKADKSPKWPQYSDRRPFVAEIGGGSNYFRLVRSTIAKMLAFTSPGRLGQTSMMACNSGEPLLSHPTSHPLRKSAVFPWKSA